MTFFKKIAFTGVVIFSMISAEVGNGISTLLANRTGTCFNQLSTAIG